MPRICSLRKSLACLTGFLSVCHRDVTVALHSHVGWVLLSYAQEAAARAKEQEEEAEGKKKKRKQTAGAQSEGGVGAGAGVGVGVDLCERMVVLRVDKKGRLVLSMKPLLLDAAASGLFPSALTEV